MGVELGAELRVGACGIEADFGPDLAGFILPGAACADAVAGVRLAPEMGAAAAVDGLRTQWGKRGLSVPRMALRMPSRFPDLTPWRKAESESPPFHAEAIGLKMIPVRPAKITVCT